MTPRNPESPNVAAWLPIMATEQPEALAVAVAKQDGGYTCLTARELDRDCDRAAHVLLKAGITTGMRTVLMVTPGAEFFALTFALFKLGAVPVLVDPGMGIRNLGQCLAEAEPEAFIGITKAQVARTIFGWGKGSVKIKITVGPTLGIFGASYRRRIRSALESPFPVVRSQPEDLAAILFTSGSTGVPKGVIYSHGMFSAQVESLRSNFGIKPGEVDLSTFPLFALFGPALGMASVVPVMDASRPGASDPKRLIQALDDFECTNMFASPALVHLIGEYAESQGESFVLESLRRVISAGAPATNAALERLARHLPATTEIFTPYGATESLPTTTIGSHEILKETRHATDKGAGVCVGKAVIGMELKVIVITDEAIEDWRSDLELPPGSIGELVVRGPVVSPSYFKRNASTKLAKIATDDGGFWHRMGDVGYVDATGRVWMCGRKSHRVVLADTTLFTIPCEAVFNTLAAVRRTALVGICRAGKTEPVLCVELESGQAASPQLDQDLRKRAEEYPHTERIREFLYHPGFPTDVRHNAKIFREKLSTWAEKKLT